MEIRLGRVDDLVSLVEIYNHYVLNSLATFDETPLTLEDRKDWFEGFDATGPYRLVVAADHRVCGYACSTPYRRHPSFSETVEFSVYLSPGRTGEGLGTKLYARLLEELAPENVHRLVAGIALPNEASVKLHRRCGFEEVGMFEEYAKKWGSYVSSVWMQRAL